MITLVDYGLGNIHAFHDIFRRLDLPVQIAATPRELAEAERLVLPGVGAFDWAMGRLDASGLREVLDDLVLGRKRPVLGVCSGMQMMARRSDEGERPGLGWIDADVRRFDAASLPHMGWNDAAPTQTDCLFRDLPNPRYYFLHSYYMVPDRSEDVLATTDYGGQFASAVRAGNVFGTQFHPEKSHQWGIRLLQNFAEL